jgi:lipopolysaccharide transport system permease protein
MKVLRNIYRQRELLWNLTLRELRTKYRRSFLGWTWSMLNPLATIIVFTFVFKVLFKAQPEPGDPSGIDSFALFMLTGLIPWGFFSLVTSLGLGSILGNPTLIRKVSFQREILVISQVLFAFVQFSIEMSIVATVIGLASGFWVLLYIPQVLLLMVLLALFSTGIAMALGVLTVYFRDLNYLWTIIIQLAFYATPVVYTDKLLASEISDPWLSILRYQPMAVFVRGFRTVMYDGRSIGVGQVATMLVACVLSLSFGFAVFRKLERRLPEEV